MATPIQPVRGVHDDGSLDVNVVSGGGTGGTSSNFAAAFPAVGSAVGFKKTSDSSMQPGTLDDSGNLNVNIKAGAGGINPTTGVLSNIAASASSQIALAANALRLGAHFFNDGDVPCYLKFGATASVSSFTEKLQVGERFVLGPTDWSGRVDVIWDSNTAAVGALRVTEVTA